MRDRTFSPLLYCLLCIAFVCLSLAIFWLFSSARILAEEKTGPDRVDSGNLVKNPGFEEGHAGPGGWKGPAYWSSIDGLTRFWEMRPGGGRCIRFDTDVYMKEVEARKRELAGGRWVPPRPKTRTSGKKYNTIGAADGVSLMSDYIPVEKDRAYILQADVKAEKTKVKVFIKGYAMVRGDRRIIYKCYKAC